MTTGNQLKNKNCILPESVSPESDILSAGKWTQHDDWPASLKCKTIRHATRLCFWLCIVPSIHQRPAPTDRFQLQIVCQWHHLSTPYLHRRSGHTPEWPWQALIVGGQKEHELLSWKVTRSSCEQIQEKACKAVVAASSGSLKSRPHQVLRCHADFRHHLGSPHQRCHQ